MEALEITTKSPKETQRAAKLLADEIRKSDIRNTALVIALRGDLGGGKTTFTQGFARCLGVRRSVLSPTFVLMQSYALPKKKSARFRKLVHIDAYRFEKPQEIAVLGWKELVSDNTNIILVEWAERLGNLLPKEKIDIEFEFVDTNTRKIFLHEESKK